MNFMRFIRDVPLLLRRPTLQNNLLFSIATNSNCCCSCIDMILFSFLSACHSHLFMYTLSIHRSIRIHQISTSHTNFDFINEWMNVCSSFWMKPLPFFSLRIFHVNPQTFIYVQENSKFMIMDGWLKKIKLM